MDIGQWTRSLLTSKASFCSAEAQPIENSLCLSAGEWKAEVFPRQPPKSWELWPPWPPQYQGILAPLKSWLFCTRKTTIIDCKS